MVTSLISWVHSEYEPRQLHFQIFSFLLTMVNKMIPLIEFTYIVQIVGMGIVRSLLGRSEVWRKKK